MTIVQVKVPVCVTIQMDEETAKGTTEDELRLQVDDILLCISKAVDVLGN